MAKTIVIEANEVECFHANNGQRIRSLKELSNAFESMDDATFGHHVNGERNDFSNWAKGVLKDDTLAEQLLGAKDKKSAQIVALKRLLAILSEIA